MGYAVLVPRYSRTYARVFNEQGLVERREIRTIYVLSDPQQLRMAVNPQAGLGKLQRAEQNKWSGFGRVVFCFWLEHFDFVAAIG